MQKIKLTLVIITLCISKIHAQVKIENNFSPSKMKSDPSGEALFQKTNMNGFVSHSTFTTKPNSVLKTAKSKKDFSDKENTSANTFKAFIGVGNTSIISDVVTLTDKSFLGELNWQIRGGVRIYQNLEFNFGFYGRQFPDKASFPALSFNKFVGYSGALVYELRKPNSRWGMPLGLEALKYQKNIVITNYDAPDYKETYQAFAFGPKIGVRYHVSSRFFLETELNAQIEHFKLETNYTEKKVLESNTLGTFKFLNISINRSF